MHGARTHYPSACRTPHFCGPDVHNDRRDDNITSYPSHTRSALRVFWLLVVLMLTSPLSTLALAQQEDPDQKTTPGYFHRTADGDEIPLSELGIKEADLEDLIRKREKKEPKLFVIRSLVIKGKVEGNLAFLDATYTVRLNTDEQWLSVPIGLDEGKLASLAKHEHADNGKAQFDRAGSLKVGTRHWFFKGKGDHKLTLPIIVQVRELQHLRHALRFRFPEAISATQLTLKVPERGILAEAPRGSGFRTTRGDDGTTIDIWGLGSQFNLQWDIRPDVADAQQFLRSRTNLSVNLSTTPFAIAAKQSLIMQQGSASTFDITIPSGFTVTRQEVQQVDPTGRVAKLDFEPTANRVRVTLAKPLTDQLDLNWTLSAIDDSPARRWLFDGFLVRDAQEQTTDLELTAPDGVAVREIKSLSVQRQTPTRKESRTTVARLLNPEAQLVVELRDVEPLYAVTPRMALILNQGQLQLESRFRIRVMRGSVQQLKLSWPNLKTEDWQLRRLDEELILPAPLGEGLAEWTTVESDETSDSITLELVTPQSDTFEIAVIADRAVRDQAEFPVSLPRLEAKIRQAASLVVATEPNTEVGLIAESGTTSEPIPTNAQQADWLAPTLEGMNLSSLLVRSDERQFEASVKTRERTVRVTRNQATIEILNNVVAAEQTLRYRVEFGHITEVRLSVPAGVEPGASVDGTTLRQLSSAPGARIYALPEPTTGEFEIDLAYRQPYKLADDRIDLPIITSTEPAGETQVGIRPDAYYRLQLTDSRWSAGFSRDLDAVWTTSEPTETLDFKASSPLAAMARRFSVLRALVQTKLAGEVAESRASFVLQGRF